MSTEAMKQALDAYCKTLHPLWNTRISRTEAEGFFEAGFKAAIAEAEKQVAFKIYKPTSPQGAIPNVRDAELPWVYDQDPSSGNVASMWVTPVKPTPQPKREPLTDEQIAEFFGVKAVDESFVDFVRAIEAAHGIGIKQRETNETQA